MLLTPSVARAARLRSLLLDAPRALTPVAVAEWFGAMQAQDVASGHWSLGVRTPAATRMDVEAAFENRALIRTWPMRQTVHIIPAVDATWMLGLTGRRGLDNMITRRQGLGLLPPDLDRLEKSLATILAAGNPVPRKEILATLADEGIPTDGQRGYHVLAYASLIGLTCIGPQQGSAQTFALLSAWAPHQRSLSRDEALAELAHRYFRSHGPATMRDFAGWTGLTLTDARRAVALNDGRLVQAGDREDSWVTVELGELLAAGGALDQPTLVLPGFDEYLLGYKDRSLHGNEDLLERVVPGGNGIFRATVVRRGIVVATWTRSLVRDRVEIEVTPIGRLSAAARREAERAFDAYGSFLGRSPVIRFGAETDV